MSTYALRGATIACYLAIGHEAYRFATQAIYPISLSYPENHANENLHAHATDWAKKMGLEKEIVVISDRDYRAYGTTFLPGKAGISLPVKSVNDHDFNLVQFHTTETLARLRSNQAVIEKVAVLAALVFYSYFRGFGFTWECKSLSAPCELLVVGVITTQIVKLWFDKYAFRTAMRSCDRIVNQKVLKELEDCDSSIQSPLFRSIFGNGSRIKELDNFIQKQPY